MLIKTITVTELKKKLLNDAVTLIDVREPEEYQAERIVGSYLIPLGEISLEKLPTESQTKSKPIVIYCRSGKRSEEACRRLLGQNAHLEIYNLEGGILAWQAS